MQNNNAFFNPPSLDNVNNGDPLLNALKNKNGGPMNGIMNPGFNQQNTLPNINGFNPNFNLNGNIGGNIMNNMNQMLSNGLNINGINNLNGMNNIQKPSDITTYNFKQKDPQTSVNYFI
jgi:hypothetical protein